MLAPKTITVYSKLIELAFSPSHIAISLPSYALFTFTFLCHKRMKGSYLCFSFLHYEHTWHTLNIFQMVSFVKLLPSHLLLKAAFHCTTPLFANSLFSYVIYHHSMINYTDIQLLIYRAIMKGMNMFKVLSYQNIINDVKSGKISQAFVSRWH